MDYCLYKLKFTAPVHFGADIPGIGIEKSELTCHADTLFSAFCMEAAILYGDEIINELAESAKTGNLLVSDLMPYYNSHHFCLPRPVLQIQKEFSIQDDSKAADLASLKKKMKDMAFVPVSQWDEYLDFLKGNRQSFDINVQYTEYVKADVFPRVVVSRTGEDAEPYLVSASVFSKDAGLYFIVGYGKPELRPIIETILKSLGYSGIGGKRSTGYGKFELDEDPIELDPNNSVYDDDAKIAELLSDDRPNYYMTLSVLCPQQGELDEETLKDSFYTLVPRRGFIASSAYSDSPLKRKPLVMFNRGSCFPKKLQGDVLDVSDRGNHPVYRYGKALMIGVRL